MTRQINISITLICMASAIISGCSGSSETDERSVIESFPFAIMKGDYPDPTVLRDGSDYYMTHSPLFYAPGFLIWHSTDLINWKPVTRVCQSFDGSGFAPELTKHDGRYYLYFPTSDGKNYVTWSNEINGPWSEPELLDIDGIDPGHIADTNGNRYLFTNQGYVTPLSSDGLTVVGQQTKVYDGWIYPEDWVTEGENMWLESPKLFHKDDYYYIVSAEGGTAGPPTSHMCVVARSKDIHGPWENSPYNPLVHTYSHKDVWWSKGHGTIIDDTDGNWWVIYHAYANNMHSLGRHTLIEPIRLTDDGWFVPDDSKRTLPAKNTIGNGMLLDDDFNTDTLGLQWTFWKWNDSITDRYSVGNNRLLLSAHGYNIAEAAKMFIIPEDDCYDVSVQVEVSDGNAAGLSLYYSERAHIGAAVNGDRIIITHSPDSVTYVNNDYGNSPYIKIRNTRNKVTIMASHDKTSWSPIAKMDVSDLNHNRYGGFSALRPALVSYKCGDGIFHEFRYYNNSDISVTGQ